MSTEDERRINLFEELGVSDERAYEIRTEILKIRDNSEYLTEILRSIPAPYDRESIIMGTFLCEMILRDDGRLLPSGMSDAVMPIQAIEILDDFFNDILSNMEDEENPDPEDVVMVDPTQN